MQQQRAWLFLFYSFCVFCLLQILKQQYKFTKRVEAHNLKMLAELHWMCIGNIIVSGYFRELQIFDPEAQLFPINKQWW